MNPQFLEVMAKRMGLSDEERSALAAGDLSVLVARSAGSGADPMSLLFLAAMMQRESPQPESAPDYATTERAISRAKAVVRKLREELSAAETMVSYVAQVFGACATCLGQNRLCLRCKGAGEPGSTEPLEDELIRWVVPALRRIGKQLAPLQTSTEHSERDLRH
jgi:hypothetical protein